MHARRMQLIVAMKNAVNSCYEHWCLCRPKVGGLPACPPVPPGRVQRLLRRPAGFEMGPRRQ
eukprot:scaffold21477_cov30-Prasinocladus_malaysianus.AAC.2